MWVYVCFTHHFRGTNVRPPIIRSGDWYYWRQTLDGRTATREWGCGCHTTIESLIQIQWSMTWMVAPKSVWTVHLWFVLNFPRNRRRVYGSSWVADIRPDDVTSTWRGVMVVSRVFWSFLQGDVLPNTNWAFEVSHDTIYGSHEQVVDQRWVRFRVSADDFPLSSWTCDGATFLLFVPASQVFLFERAPRGRARAGQVGSWPLGLGALSSRQ